ncbi:hypothetical protein I2I11_00470 [Pontibacter sp. 172403-2]|uniref:hypothetical protein n=1 Tax=Pontibacter rufus TaxID=2791028 RepID=UPI0018AF754D|nr:hypothetical protein [Pontibacter sp. 172403-2]MBF9251756.1 hypothetical protein [Pontibacter sp. 172403-2]
MGEKTENHLLRPWAFYNADEQMFSPNKQNRIEYSELIELAMGSPLAGECYWCDSDNKRHKLSGLYGGPPIWNPEGNMVAIPIWNRTLFKGTIQQLSVIDVIKSEWTQYKRTFRILDLRSFRNKIISGYDSPIYDTTPLHFDLSREEIEKRKKI